MTSNVWLVRTMFLKTTTGAVGRLTQLTHVHVNMPVLSEFDVRPAVRAWFSGAKRRPHLCKKQLISVGLPMYLHSASLYEPTQNRPIKNIITILSTRFVELVNDTVFKTFHYSVDSVKIQFYR